MQEYIKFEVIGDYPARTFFAVGERSGEITVHSDLKKDNLKSTEYIVSNIIVQHVYGIYSLSNLRHS